MAVYHHYFIGNALPVAQVTTVQVTAYDAGTTYKLTIGGIIVSVIAAGGVNATATALAAAWTAKNHAYTNAVTATASTDTVTLTAVVAGSPFTVASSRSGGAGTIGAAADATANSSPNDWNNTANWSTGVVPQQETGTAQAGAASTITLTAGASAVNDYYKGFVVRTTGGTGTGQQRKITAYNGTTKVATVDSAWGTNPDNTTTYAIGDKVTVQDISVPILWGLDQSSVILSELNLWRTFATPAQLGLPLEKFTTGEGETDDTAYEYREDWLKIGAVYVNVGEHNGPGSPSFATLIKLDLQTSNVTVKVFNSSEGNDDRPAVRLKMNHASATLAIYGDGTQVALATEEPADTSTLDTAWVFGSDALLMMGANVTTAVVDLQAGTGVLKNAPTTIRCESAATLHLAGGAVPGGNTITLLEMRGTLDMTGGDYVITRMKG